MALDVTSREQVDNVMAEAVKQLGGLDILVNCASLLAVRALRLGLSTA